MVALGLLSSLNRKLLRDLHHLRGQVIAVSLVVACGVAAYVGMRTAFQSLLRAQTEYYSSYRFAHVFASAKRAPDSMLPSLRAIPGVIDAESRIVRDVTLDVPGLNEPATGRLISLPAHHSSQRLPRLNALSLRKGNWPDAAKRGEVLVSEAFAAANHLHPGSRINAVINGRWQPLLITGTVISPEFIYEVRAGEVFGDNRRFGVLWMSHEGLAAAFQMEGAFNDVSFLLGHGAKNKEVIARIDAELERYGGLGAFDRNDHVSARIVADHIEEIRISGIILPSIFLAVVAFLLHTVMSRSVHTQRAQIAVLKAFGYGHGEIAAHFLKFALAAVAGGTVLGVALGLWLGAALLRIFALYFHFPSLALHPDAKLMVAAAGISAFAACLGTIAAVRQVVALSPAEAMQPEPPKRFRAGFMVGTFWRFLLNQEMRIVLRNLDRRRMRAALSILSVSAAGAILVVGWYRFDAVNQLAATQFDHVQREDIAVLFHEPRPLRALYELRRLPGVLRAEPFRQVPVRFRFGPRERRSSIVGLAPRAELRRPIDDRLLAVDLPPHGLLMNSKLAEILGASLGDSIQVEILEGSRPSLRLRLEKLIDEPVGLNAYLDADSLRRVLREGDNLSGAYLRVDPSRWQRIYGDLKRTPFVAGVSVKQTAMASFWSSIGDSLNATTYTLVAFASVIACGVIYNSARIALSERGHELATLRVLGFTKWEVARILLGEQALLVLLSLPVGLALGHLLAWSVAVTHSPDLLRLPFALTNRTYASSAITVCVAACVSAAIVARRLRKMDLTEVLKSRE